MTQTKVTDVDPNLIDFQKRKAENLVKKGVQLVEQGKAELALEAFKESASLKPSSEAYTYWAWMLSARGELEEAIELCLKAIEIDPTFGNPYNDIGTYYMKKGELDQAIPWLEKAKLAPRYEPRHYPCLNLGRIYLSRCHFSKALREFDEALVFDPQNEELRMVAERIRKRLSREETYN